MLVDAGVDGTYAEVPEDCAYYLSPQLWRRLDGARVSDDMTITRSLGTRGYRIRSSAHVADAALAQNKLIGVVSKARGLDAAAQVTLWPGVRLIRDEASQARKGEIVLTARMEMDLTVPRPANFEAIGTAV